MVSLPTLAFVDVSKYLDRQQLLARQADTPDLVKQIGARFAHGANEVLQHLGIDNATVEGIGARNEHILGQTFHTMGALRFGEYIAKISAAPLSENVKALEGTLMGGDGGFSAIRDDVVDFSPRAGRGVRAAGAAVHQPRPDAGGGRVGALGRGEVAAAVDCEDRHPRTGCLQPTTPGVRR